jgi:hypothetical protein
MTLKKFLHVASFVMIAALVLPVTASSEVSVSNKPGSEKAVDPKVAVLMQRLNEIKTMDRTEMTSLERKNLRKEVKEIKSEMKAISGGVYLSVGAIIIVILLLILLL